MPTNTKPAWGGKPTRTPHVEQFVTGRDYARLNIAGLERSSYAAQDRLCAAGPHDPGCRGRAA